MSGEDKNKSLYFWGFFLSLFFHFIIVILAIALGMQLHSSKSDTPSRDKHINIASISEEKEQVVDETQPAKQDEPDKKTEQSVHEKKVSTQTPQIPFQPARSAEKKAEAKKKVEAERKAEVRRKAEAKKKAEAEKKAEAKRKIEAERKAEVKRKAEAKKKAEAEKKAEAKRKVEAERKAEVKRKAEAKKKAEAERKAKVESILKDLKKDKLIKQLREEKVDPEEADLQFISKREVILGDYTKKVTAKIQDSFTIPESVPRDGLLVAKIFFEMDRNGVLSKVNIKESSGNSVFDSFCIKTIKSSSPFPLPPDDVAKQVFEEGLEIALDNKIN